MNKQLIASGAEWEDIVGYSRGVRIGNIVEIAGTTALRDGKVVGKGDPYQQTICILEIIEKALNEAGASIQDVIRTRIFVTDIDQWEAVGRAHGEYFKNVKPVSTMVEVSRLIEPGLMVEIEATAFIQS